MVQVNIQDDPKPTDPWPTRLVALYGEIMVVFSVAYALFVPQCSS